MQRLEYDRYGGPELVHLSPYTLPEPRPDEIVVRVAASSINPMDWKIRRGAMKMMTGSKFPRALGTDFAGTVEAVGSRVATLRPGDEVVGTVSMKQSGAFAPRLVTREGLVVVKPPSLSFAEAATLPIAGVTAWQVLVRHAKLRHGQKLLINGASGAVGRAAIAVAQEIGAVVTGRVGPRSVAQAQALGLSAVLDYTSPLPSSLDGSFDLVFDANGSLTIRDGDRLIRRGGKVIDIVPTPLKFLRALVSPTRQFVFADVESGNLQPVVDLAAAGKLRIPIVRTISLAQAPAVLASLERGTGFGGKAVIAF